MDPNRHRGPGWPDGEDDVINKYGEYEVQATNGTEHAYPQIAQYLSREEARLMQAHEARWRAEK